MKDIKRPLRYFHGIGVCESKLKICCTPYDSNEKNIYVDEKNIFDESNHDKSFVFSNISGDLKLVEEGNAPRKAYYALTTKEYENLSMNMAEITRYIKETLGIIEFYREYDKKEEDKEKDTND